MNKNIMEIIENFSNDTKRLLQDNLIAEYLFGSFARNKETEFSDIDILIIVKHFDYKIRRKISALSSDYSLTQSIYISPIIKDLQIWKKNKEYNTLFYQEIQRDGIKL
ncbi:MAG: nucleotidyltransferase domain-containing protein [Candidatus Cloacimonetes bacterium]|nr:nucleotidyltransferase domain-containing protein [Candidatus Cloacimonadota bacterium]